MITMQEPSLPIATTTVTNLTYRLAPSLKGKKLGTCKANTDYPYLGQTDLIDGHRWGKLIIDDMIVYASMAYLELTIPQIVKPVHVTLLGENLKVQVDTI